MSVCVCDTDASDSVCARERERESERAPERERERERERSDEWIATYNARLCVYNVDHEPCSIHTTCQHGCVSVCVCVCLGMSIV